VGVYIYESEDMAIRNRNIMEYGLEHRKAVYTGRETQECDVDHGTGTGTRIGTGTELGLNLKEKY